MALSFSKDELRKEINGEKVKTDLIINFSRNFLLKSRDLFDDGRQINIYSAF